MVFLDCFQGGFLGISPCSPVCVGAEVVALFLPDNLAFKVCADPGQKPKGAQRGSARLTGVGRGRREEDERNIVSFVWGAQLCSRGEVKDSDTIGQSKQFLRSG